MTAGSPELPSQGMVLTGVALAGDPRLGTAVVDGLSLLFKADGITIQGPLPGGERFLAWSSLTSASCREQLWMADGTTAVVLTLVSSGEVVRVLLPRRTVTAGQVAYLDQALPGWLAWYGGAVSPVSSLPSSPPSAPLGPPPTAGPLPPPPTAPTFSFGQTSPPRPPEMGWAVAPTWQIGADNGEAGHPRQPKKLRTLLIVGISIVVLLAAGLGSYFAVDNSSTTTTTQPQTKPKPLTPAQRLADSINLRETDLPGGWSVSGTSNPPLTPSEKRAIQQAATQLAGCLDMPSPFIDGLFGTSDQKDEVAVTQSPTFASAATPSAQIQSQTTVVKTAADATKDATPFVSSKFGQCFGTFQSAVLASELSGATSQTSSVPLIVPSGVQAVAYVTTASIPGEGSVATENIFMIGGRAESNINVQTAGTSVPAAATNAAYGAMVKRIAALPNT